MLLKNFDMEKEDPTYKLKIKQCLSIKPDGFRMRVTLRNRKRPVDLIRTRELTATAAPPQSTAGAARNTVAGQGHPITILYGSNTGTCEALAHRLASDASGRGFEAKMVVDMNTAKGNLPKDQPVIIVAASYNGYPSDNATDLVAWLAELSSTDLCGVRYAVFGIGKRIPPYT
jgi:cytochrome P450 / NADPH-cytochrome P450 reductase